MPSLLDRFNLDYGDLTPDEKETLKQWQQSLSKKELTVDKVAEYVKTLIQGVEKEISELHETTSFWTYTFGWKKDFYLKARLKNYLIIHDFVSAPERARKYIEESLNNIK